MKILRSSHPLVAGRTRFESAGAEIDSLASGFNPPGALVEVTLVGERRMSYLNRTYRGRRGAAEILTFSYAGGGDEPGAVEEVAGEIFICWRRLAAGARVRNVAVRAYLLRLVAHGLCHIQGFSHGDEVSELEMERVETEHLRHFLSHAELERLFA